jgi:hypothetical protein
MSRFLLNNLANSVLPVPVGPKKMKLAVGLCSLPMPANET